MNLNWKKMPLPHKIATIIAVLVVAVWVVYRIKPTLFPVNPTYPAIAVFTICEAVVYWQKSKKWAVLLIAAAVLSLAVFVIECLL